jgi:DNA-directed RNA polymerase sigma subunit (sigma70/sigma32)
MRTIVPLDPTDVKRDTDCMGDPLSFMSEDGWPYPDDDDVDEQFEPIDLRAEADDDLVALHALSRRAVFDLSSTERTVIARRFGFDGQPPSTLSELHAQLGLSRREIREVLLEGITKLRTQLGPV